MTRFSLFIFIWSINFTISFAQTKWYAWSEKKIQKIVNEDKKRISDQIENAIQKGDLTFMQITDIMSSEMLEENANAVTDFLLNCRNNKNDKTNTNGIYFIIDSSKMTDSVLIKNLSILKYYNIEELRDFRGWLTLQDIEKVLDEESKMVLSLYYRLRGTHVFSIYQSDWMYSSDFKEEDKSISDGIYPIISRLIKSLEDKIEKTSELQKYFQLDPKLMELIQGKENPYLIVERETKPKSMQYYDPYDSYNLKELYSSRIYYIKFQKLNSEYLFQGFLEFLKKEDVEKKEDLYETTKKIKWLEVNFHWQDVRHLCNLDEQFIIERLLQKLSRED